MSWVGNSDSDMNGVGNVRAKIFCQTPLVCLYTLQPPPLLPRLYIDRCISHSVLFKIPHFKYQEQITEFLLFHFTYNSNKGMMVKSSGALGSDIIKVNLRP